MAKIYGLFGSMVGKVADVVMTVRGGEQIVRKYQPSVFNPQTPAQIASRARFKLLVQLSTVLSPFIAIRKVGNVSARNLFVRLNYNDSTFALGNADINMSAVKLTKSVVGFPQVTASRAGNVLTVEMDASPQDVSRVVYVAVVRNDDNTLRAVGSTVVSEAGVSGAYTGTINVPGSGDIYVYAYGVRENSDAAKSMFGNLTNPEATQIARIVTTSALTEADVTLTETRYTSVVAGV